MVRLDRVGRMPMSAIAAISEIRELGVTIRTRTDGDIKLARVMDQVGPILASIQSGLENEARSDKVKAGYERKRAGGLLVATKPPYGVVKGQDGKAAPDRACAPIVREVYRRWNRGDAPSGIVEWLRRNAPPREGKSKPLPMRWSLSHLYKMVHLPTYRGVVIPPDAWDRAQKRRKSTSRPGKGGRIYPFAGVRCSCGDRLHPRTNTAPTRHTLNDGRVVVYERKTMSVWYVCQSLKHRSGPRFRSFSEAALEESWADVLRDLAKSKAWTITSRVGDPSPEIAHLQQKIDGIARRRARIHSAFENGDYDAATMRQRLEATDGMENALRTLIADLRARFEEQKLRKLESARVAELLRYAPKLYERGTRAERKRINAGIFAAFGYPVVSDDYALEFPALSRGNPKSNVSPLASKRKRKRSPSR